VVIERGGSIISKGLGDLSITMENGSTHNEHDVLKLLQAATAANNNTSTPNQHEVSTHPVAAQFDKPSSQFSGQNNSSWSIYNLSSNRYQPIEFSNDLVSDHESVLEPGILLELDEDEEPLQAMPNGGLSHVSSDITKTQEDTEPNVWPFNFKRL